MSKIKATLIFLAILIVGEIILGMIDMGLGVKRTGPGFFALTFSSFLHTGLTIWLFIFLWEVVRNDYIEIYRRFFREPQPNDDVHGIPDLRGEGWEGRPRRIILRENDFIDFGEQEVWEPEPETQVEQFMGLAKRNKNINKAIIDYEIYLRREE